ncbi:DUF305 domain-containing protein [Couchioplanes azureus]|uniref:DUF305 domain-containing protein n=1 Tax=Couchioplanes caeruleus TaxID=56438 RepID=UPI001670F11A|nr:DUF305 domain-containing protein [Couchioplanes caeruleus]GGQ75013.1 lipoprotein [Couchioplanes caeruleus subsp. azureus]
MSRYLLRRAVPAGVAVVFLFAGSGCGGGDHSSTGSSGHGSAASAPAGSPAPGAQFGDADVAFAQHMIVHHRQAVEMASLAGTRAANAEVERLAAKIKSAQDPEVTTMAGWLGAWGEPVPAPDAHGAGHESMPGMMSQDDITKLAAASGPAFDKQFLTMMIAHHEGAITMADEESGAGVNLDAKALAAKIAADQQAEIGLMEDLLGRL